MFLDGYSFYRIAAELTKRGISTPYGLQTWNGRTVKIFCKMKNTGVMHCFRNGIPETFLTVKMRKNEGAVPQYYIVGNHEAIIDTRCFRECRKN
ncbi:MAG: recombinase family protein [Ruminococcus sp.]